MKWRIIAACGLVALAAFGFGCAAQTGVAPSGDTKVADEEQTNAQPLLYPGEAESGVDRDVLAAQATQARTVAEAAESSGIPLTVLEPVSEASIAGVWVSNPEMKPPFLLVEYDDGTLIDVTVLESAEEALRLADPGVDDPQLAPLINAVDVNGAPAYAIEKMDVPAEYTAGGDVVPGTGVRRGTTKIAWGTGSYSVRVMSGTKDVDGLLPVARGVQFTK